MIQWVWVSLPEAATGAECYEQDEVQAWGRWQCKMSYKYIRYLTQQKCWFYVRRSQCFYIVNWLVCHVECENHHAWVLDTTMLRKSRPFTNDFKQSSCIKKWGYGSEWKCQSPGEVSDCLDLTGRWWGSGSLPWNKIWGLMSIHQCPWVSLFILSCFFLCRRVELCPGRQRLIAYANLLGTLTPRSSCPAI